MANAIFASAGSSGGAKSPRAKLITSPPGKQRIGFPRSRSNNLNAPLLSSNQMEKHFLPRKTSIAHCDVDLRENGWPGVMITFPGSQQFPNLRTSVSLVSAVSALLLRACSGGKTFVHRHIFGLGAGFFARSASFIYSHSFRSGCRSTGSLAATECL